VGPDLSDLYTPRELAEQRLAFLERVLGYYAEVHEISERARIVGHKLRGTGGLLGLTVLSEWGGQLQLAAVEGDTKVANLDQELERLRPAIEAAIREEQDKLAA
jgi:hypothetical protein